MQYICWRGRHLIRRLIRRLIRHLIRRLIRHLIRRLIRHLIRRLIRHLIIFSATTYLHASLKQNYHVAMMSPSIWDKDTIQWI